MQQDNSHVDADEYPEETKAGENFNGLKKQQTEDDIVNDLVKYFEDIFSIENFKRNKYFMNRTNPYLEISVKDIEVENGVRGITNNKNLINKALSKISSISLLNNGFVKLKNLQPRNKIIIRDINMEDDLELNKLLDKYEEKDKIISHSYDPKLKYMIVILHDETSANNLLNYLNKQAIKGHSIDCGLSEENIFISMKNELTQKSRYPPYQNFQTQSFLMAFTPQMYPYPNLQQYPQQQTQFYQRQQYNRFQRPNYPKINQNQMQSSYQGIPMQIKDTELQAPPQPEPITEVQENEGTNNQQPQVQKHEQGQQGNLMHQFGGAQKNYKPRPRNNYNRGPRYYSGGGYGNQYQQFPQNQGYYQNPDQYQVPHQGYYSGLNKNMKGKYNHPASNKPQQKEEIVADFKNFPPLNN